MEALSQRTAKYAERACLVSMALDVPVHVDIVVQPVAAHPSRRVTTDGV